MRFPLVLLGVACLLGSASCGRCEDPSDPIINLFLQKGFITEAEAAKARAEVEAIRTNQMEMPPLPKSKWRFGDNIKSLQLTGDVRLRYEDRSVQDPAGGQIDLQRFRYAVRLGLKGDVFDDFYYGVRLETSSNPRSSWVTFGSSSGGVPYQGPFGKSTAGIAVGQAYLGWHRWNGLDLTLGKMPNPLFTTPMVWDPDINPEGAAEKVKYRVGDAELFGTFGQFLYQDLNPVSASDNLGFGTLGQHTDNIFLFAWQAGARYRFSTNTTAKFAATLYHYTGLQRSSASVSDPLKPYFGDPYIGEGVYVGTNSTYANGYSGYGSSSSLPGYGSIGFPLNQVGLDHLLVVELPFQLDFKLSGLDAEFFGDFSYNLEGNERARAAAKGYANWLATETTYGAPSVKPFSPQLNQDKAYQIGFALGSKTGWRGRVNHPWQFRTYWQHTEQYALDPNLIDSDTFEGRENLQGINVQLAYGLTPNFIASIRYAYAMRIDKNIGTGGSNQDVPQMNPINQFNLLQLDLAFHF